jgi:hypothetical protein
MDGHHSALVGGNIATIPNPLVSIVTHLDATPSSSGVDKKEHHTTALRNFCLLLLEVDGADHLRMGQVPHARTKFRRRGSMDLWAREEVGHDGGEVGYQQDKDKRRDSVDSLGARVAHWSVKDVNP